MAITIGSNIASLLAQRKLEENSRSLNKTYERLSSGLRINHASDDAAGLALSSTLNASAKILGQATRNLNDGISLIAVADSAINALTDITTRLIELSEQAATGTYSNKQREALDKEAQTLAQEYFRISRTTQFNGTNLFDGSVQGLTLQAGAGANALLQSSLGGKLGTGNLGPANSFTVGDVPKSVATGDLNGDGVLDLVTANAGSDNISVLLGNGNGTFAAQSTLSAGDSPCTVSLADLNGDGLLDAVTANTNDDTLSVLFGNGDGTFEAKTSVATGDQPYSLAIADLNGDGILDLATANSQDQAVSVLIGNGDGTFQAPSNFATGSDPRSLTAGDFNGDGKLDLATANYQDNTLTVLLNQGNGAFTPAGPDLTVGWGPNDVAFGDLNKDGKLDIVSVDQTDCQFSIFLGNGNGTFTAGTTVELGLGTNPYQAVLADLNGDGNLDLVSSNNTSASSVLLGKGDGTFGQRFDFDGGTASYSATVGDFNGDGVLDFVTANITTDRISVVLGQTRDGISPILPFSLQTKADALQAMAPLKRTLDSLATQRGILGAFESRISYATSTLNATLDNYKAAESRIKDADVAEEVANLARQQILQEVGAAMLAQANQQPKVALSLLQDMRQV